jgi:class 3 adenylate cyclase
LAQKPDITEIGLGNNRPETLTSMDIRYHPDPAFALDTISELDQVNRFLGYMAPIVRKHGGTPIHFRPDGLTAVFPGEVALAIDAALAIVNSLAEPKANLAIGLHHGPVLMAIIGETQHLETGLFADSVGIAASLAGLCRKFGTSILVSGGSVQRLKRPENYSFRVIGNFRLGDSPEAQTVAEFYDSDGQDHWRRKRETKKVFEYAVHLYLLKRYPESKEMFEKHLAQFPDDSMALFYLNLLK